MKYLSTISLFISILLLSSCDLLNDAIEEQENNIDIAEGLKEALKVGTDTATSKLAVVDGYLKDEAVKILLPDELEAQIAALKAVEINVFGLGTITGDQIYNTGVPFLGINSLAEKEEELIVGINRAAEEAAQEAGPIFFDAIRGITITDAENILYGSDTAATAYLIDNTYQSLFDTFEPKVNNAVNSVSIGERTVEELYGNFVSEYNDILNTSVPISFLESQTLGSISGINSIDEADISAFATEKGLDGLFLKVQDEEANIRNNVNARVNELLQQVFGLLD
ncbi:hypothetical protein MATR_07130 [Marivirga tractuosa]|uniref:Lipoprotein n=1 Tax=Marivirga tractuosa (strain ATCC 23168 / DSM 4126 / NBRC 15989 / NCIMB 1408 / VKM B-1430 / H-43) TaxID=643867 RepID=E4TQV5_MARTH|nr:DUF4197 domain-containing protein [Marivirga tractuosa]ADR21655.1 hypothetical protein Ftrac_1667 [Marivirga tractuosa DSM 4126]BDD13888.1 hypothetical protein MATR_07130 [Marivirga tractuosa]